MPIFADNADLKAFTALLPDARFAPVIPGWEEIAAVTSNALQKIYLGEGEIKPTLDGRRGQDRRHHRRQQVSTGVGRATSVRPPPLPAVTEAACHASNRSIFVQCPIVLIAPAFLLAAFIILWPLFQIGEISVQRRQPLRPAARPSPASPTSPPLVTDPHFFAALWRTVIWTVGVVVGTIADLGRRGADPQRATSTAAASPASSSCCPGRSR